MLEDILKSNQESKIQKYLEEHPFILKMGIGVPDWAFNYVLPQFMLGSHLRADFIVLTGQSYSYEVTIVELKKPEASLYNKDGSLAKDFNRACTQIDDYRRWMKDNTDEFKRDLLKEIKKQDPLFEENFDWTRRFRIFSAVVIGRRAKLSREHRDKNFDMEDKGVRAISYDRLVDAERRLCEMLDKKIDLNYFNRDYLIRERYNMELENQKPDRDSIGTDHVLYLGDEEQRDGRYGL